MRGSRDGVEFESLTGLAGVLEEVHGDVRSLVLDGGGTGEESVDHIIQLGGSHGGGPLQDGTEGRLEDGEALEGAGGGVVERHIGHWGIRVVGGRRGGRHVAREDENGRKMSGRHLDASEATRTAFLFLSHTLSLLHTRSLSHALLSLSPSWSRRVQCVRYGQHGVRDPVEESMRRRGRDGVAQAKGGGL